MEEIKSDEINSAIKDAKEKLSGMNKIIEKMPEIEGMLSMMEGLDIESLTNGSLEKFTDVAKNASLGKVTSTLKSMSPEEILIDLSCTVFNIVFGENGSLPTSTFKEPYRPLDKEVSLIVQCEIKKDADVSIFSSIDKVINLDLVKEAIFTVYYLPSATNPLRKIMVVTDNGGCEDIEDVSKECYLTRKLFCEHISFCLNVFFAAINKNEVRLNEI